MMKNILSGKISIYGRGIAHRMLFQPMEGCDGTKEGAIDELTIRRYLRFAEGAPGIIWFGATAVCNEGRAIPVTESKKQLSACTDEVMTDSIRKRRHLGRYAS